jgi:hypothetical protein
MRGAERPLAPLCRSPRPLSPCQYNPQRSTHGAGQTTNRGRAAQRHRALCHANVCASRRVLIRNHRHCRVLIRNHAQIRRSGATGPARGGRGGLGAPGGSLPSFSEASAGCQQQLGREGTGVHPVHRRNSVNAAEERQDWQVGVVSAHSLLLLLAFPFDHTHALHSTHLFSFRSHSRPSFYSSLFICGCTHALHSFNLHRPPPIPFAKW